uniref:alpha-L-fucosidase n=1 Tax=Ignisphaera aggregans TaxID=334771 RepID=A0A7C5TIP5_9CREN
MGFKADWSYFKKHYEEFNKEFKPSWFHDAKLGVIIHWGPYSVPGWAPPLGELSYIPMVYGWDFWFRYNPYAEWYLNTLRISGSATAIFHELVYGRDFPYERFAKIFEEESNKWSASDWVELFNKAGVRYVVFTTKHHDGYLLWPSDVKNPRKRNWFSQRDIVGELAKECRNSGLRFATYYSSGFDWTFNDTVITDHNSFAKAMTFGNDYREYLKGHWHELIDRYKPDVLWSDIGYPFEEDLPELFLYYYNKVSEGIINDRFTKKHYDFITPEYRLINKISEEKWETVRGVGYSFGYNRAEGPEHSLSYEKLIHLLIDVISKNGNLLLGVTPRADGTIPEHQVEVLLKLGQWLKTYCEAIYGTRPWIQAEGIAISSDDAIQLRFVKKEEKLYAFLLGKPRSRKLILKPLDGGFKAKESTSIEMLGEEPIKWRQISYGIEIELPRYIYLSPVYIIKIEPIPEIEK